MKDSGFRIRVEQELRKRFLEVCRQHDRPAAQVLREFMREFIEKHEEKADKKKSGKRGSNNRT